MVGYFCLNVANLLADFWRTGIAEKEPDAALRALWH